MNMATITGSNVVLSNQEYQCGRELGRSGRTAQKK